MRSRAFLLLVFCLALAARAPGAVAPAPQAFQQEIAGHHAPAAAAPTGAVEAVIVSTGNVPRVRVNGGWLELRDGSWRSIPAPHNEPLTALPDGTPVIQDARSPQGDRYAATATGLWVEKGGRWEKLVVADGLGRHWATADVRGVAFDARGQLWFATLAGVGCRGANGWRFFDGRDGLPWNDFTCVAAGPDGAVWFGTRRGAIRWDGKEFHYRQGPRWLPDDDVRGIAVEPDGSAWFATARGVGRIERRAMTLAAKAEFYEAELERVIKRTPFGYTAEVGLSRTGDRASAVQHDSDNDGLWTAMYGAGECFAYAATGDPRARQRATQAFAALKFLQDVTQGGEHPAPRGFVARTIRPVTWPDPNRGRLEQDLAQQKNDVLWKAHQPRWPRSADGKWYWKSDTSSDELDGHYFFYPLYHDLVAQTPEEKESVRRVVRDLTDHLIQHGFTLTDHDGKPTRWGMYAPETLNRDSRWWAERGLNSLSMLAYLAVAEHVTGDAHYGAVARELIDRHGFAQNLLFPKVQAGPGSGNQSDDEMAFMCFYSLLRYSRDEALRNTVRTAFYAYWQNEAAELNPFFNFAYAAVADGQVMRNLWGEFPVSPRAGWHEESIATLRGFPLDRVNWPLRNSHRLDVVRLPDGQAIDFYEPGNAGRGHRVNGRVLPVENRHFNHWNTDPWKLDEGGAGNSLGSGTVFLLPYYMGLYHGYIAKP